MAHSLGLRVIAEGVEQHEILIQLRKHKCDFAQGFSIAKPMAAKDFQYWTEHYKPKLVL